MMFKFFLAASLLSAVGFAIAAPTAEPQVGGLLETVEGLVDTVVGTVGGLVDGTGGATVGGAPGAPGGTVGTGTGEGLPIPVVGSLLGGGI